MQRTNLPTIHATSAAANLQTVPPSCPSKSKQTAAISARADYFCSQHRTALSVTVSQGRIILSASHAAHVLRRNLCHMQRTNLPTIHATSAAANLQTVPPSCPSKSKQTAAISARADYFCSQHRTALSVTVSQGRIIPSVSQAAHVLRRNLCHMQRTNLPTIHATSATANLQTVQLSCPSKSKLTAAISARADYFCSQHRTALSVTVSQGRIILSASQAAHVLRRN